LLNTTHLPFWCSTTDHSRQWVPVCQPSFSKVLQQVQNSECVLNGILPSY